MNSNWWQHCNAANGYRSKVNYILTKKSSSPPWMPSSMQKWRFHPPSHGFGSGDQISVTDHPQPEGRASAACDWPPQGHCHGIWKIALKGHEVWCTEHPPNSGQWWTSLTLAVQQQWCLKGGRWNGVKRTPQFAQCLMFLDWHKITTNYVWWHDAGVDTNRSKYSKVLTLMHLSNGVQLDALVSPCLVDNETLLHSSVLQGRLHIHDGTVGWTSHQTWAGRGLRKAGKDILHNLAEYGMILENRSS